MNLIEMAKQYAGGIQILRDWLGEDACIVDSMHSQRRAIICQICPKNRRGWFIPRRVSQAIKKQVALKKNLSLTVLNEKKLKTCKVCRCPVALKIWLPLEYITRYMRADEFAKYPSNCWIVTESPQPQENLE